jgi:hypothetical protein
MDNGVLTLLTSNKPDRLAKIYRERNGQVEKITAGDMYAGIYEQKFFDGVGSFAELITNTMTNQALMASVPLCGKREGMVVSKANAAAHPSALTRTPKAFGFPAGQRGLIVLDYDPAEGTAALTMDALWTLLVAVAPLVANASALGWCSSSSFIFNGDVEVYGLRGQRIYLLVEDIGDTERVGQVLAQRLWLAGQGRIMVSRSGSRLKRTVFDSAMFQPARMDFCAGAACEPPLVQKRPPPVVLSNNGWLDTRAAFKDLTPAENEKYVALVQQAMDQTELAAHEARERWKKDSVVLATEKLSKTGMPYQQAVEQAGRMLEAALGGTLMGEFEVTLADGRKVTVGSILDNRERYHGALTLDPLEPEYANRKVTGKLFLYGATPTLHSFARGGATYRLRRQPHRIYSQRGRKSELVAEIRKVLAGEPDVFLRGGTLVHVEGGKLRQLRKHNLAYLIGTRTAIYTKNEKGQDIATDVPNDVVDMVIATMEGA